MTHLILALGVLTVIALFIAKLFVSFASGLAITAIVLIFVTASFR